MLRILIVILAVILAVAIFCIVYLYKENKKLKALTSKAISFQDLCIQINSLLNKNLDLYREFSPNGDDLNEGSEIRNKNSLLMWAKFKEEAIIPNNKKILDLINNNEKLIYEKNKKLFEKMRWHINAFALHVENENFDYSEYQFPGDFANFIKRECSNINPKEINEIKNWLRKEMKDISMNELFLYGSILDDYFKNINDIDVLILLNEQVTKETSKKITEVKEKFKKKFKKSLDISVSSIEEISDYNDFKNKLSQLEGI